MNLTLPPPGMAAALIVLVVIAAAFDIRYRRIPNWIPLGGAVIGLALNTFLSGGLTGFIFSLKGLAVGFGVYFLLYALHAMGAGDVKLMGALGSLVGWERWFAIFLISAILGGVLALIVVILRGRIKTTVWNIGYILGEMSHGRAAYTSREELDVKSSKSVRLPHGAVIALGAFVFLALSARFAG